MKNQETTNNNEALDIPNFTNLKRDKERAMINEICKLKFIIKIQYYIFSFITLYFGLALTQNDRFTISAVVVCVIITALIFIFERKIIERL